MLSKCTIALSYFQNEVQYGYEIQYFVAYSCTIKMFYFLLKYLNDFQIIINFRHGLMWFGLLHLISANLVLWVLAVIIEAHEGFHSSLGSHGTEDQTTENHTTTTTRHSIHKRASGKDQPSESIRNMVKHFVSY